MKINSENDKLQFIIPGPEKFKFAFINTIQQIELPNKYIINHNWLSEFARLAYIYIAVVVEPRKRQSKLKVDAVKKSKFGFYGRYKRIPKYENDAKIEHRIISFLKNYEYIEKIITVKIAEQYNITDKLALQKIQEVKEKFPNLKRSRKFLKSLDNIPKYKPPGVDVNIQGKNIDNVKMRISGARNKEQLDDITQFMNILLYLYVEIYHKKNPELQYLKEELKPFEKIVKVFELRSIFEEPFFKEKKLIYLSAK